MESKIGGDNVNGGSIGIIGGADGPTHIYVMEAGFSWGVVLAAVIAAAAILGYVYYKKRKK